MIDNKLNEFLEIIKTENKGKSLSFILNLLDDSIPLETVYENYLIPALNNFECEGVEKEICIWKEHTRTSIIRTILESSYKYLIDQRQKSIHKSVVVVCPQEEYHEIGAIIASNFFELAGFDSKYIGANTPSDDIISAIKVMKPDFVALSVTDYYNLVVTKKLTMRIKELYPNTKIILGGQAFKHEDALKQVTYDYVLQTKDDIYAFAKEVEK